MGLNTFNFIWLIVYSQTCTTILIDTFAKVLSNFQLSFYSLSTHSIRISIGIIYTYMLHLYDKYFYLHKHWKQALGVCGITYGMTVCTLLFKEHKATNQFIMTNTMRRERSVFICYFKSSTSLAFIVFNICTF